jgi:ABC-type dipeptide/oligopeptide/nickel transport system permease component
MAGGRSISGIAWFVARRFLITLPILFGIVTVVFVITRVIPGDPAYRIAGIFATPEKIATIQQQLGTDRPIWDQYVDYVSGIIRGDLGTSISTGNPVWTELIDRLPATFELILLALAFALTLGVITGAWAARRAGGWSDRGVRVVSFIGLSLPDFWLGLLLLFVFFFTLGWAPGPFGQLSATGPQVDEITGAALIDAIITGNAAGAQSAFRHAVLPVLTLGLIFFAPFARLTRSATIEVLGSDYMLFGRACGLRPSTLRRYAIRAALPPVVTFAGILIAVMIGGAVLVETVFAWNGVAQFAAGSIQKVDYPVIQGFLLMTGVISVAIFLLVDLLYVLIDPRVKL